MTDPRVIRIKAPEPLRSILNKTEIILPESRKHLLELTFMGNDLHEVAYDVPKKGRVIEATVAKCRNAAVVNYPDPYMRRRDPEAMVIADDNPSDKTRFHTRFNREFAPIREATFEWLRNQEKLLVLPFMSGDKKLGYPTLLIAPENAGFFVTGLADLQGFIPAEEIPTEFTPCAVIYLAPPFRHTEFGGKQVVVHNRLEGMHELFSYNLYPGPSAKKGVYGILLHRGEQENWTTLHSSAVRLITPYDNEFTIMHEGASGGIRVLICRTFSTTLIPSPK